MHHILCFCILMCCNFSFSLSLSKKRENQGLSILVDKQLTCIYLYISLIADRQKCHTQRMMGLLRVTTAPRDWLMFTLGRPTILCARHFWRSAIRLMYNLAYRQCDNKNTSDVPSSIDGSSQKGMRVIVSIFPDTYLT